MEFLLSRAQKLLPKLVEWRRHLHAHPELSFLEKNTATFLWQTISLWPEVVLRAPLPTAVVADLITDVAGPWVALRADIDALPIQEISRPYASKVPGVMHACGHDAHTAMLLGALALLYELRERWRGGVRFIFQPGEEQSPGGASLLLQAGTLSEWPFEAIYAQHVTPSLPVGTIGLRAGPFMAASDELHLIIQGKGGHAAYPHLTIDPIWIGAQLITSLQGVISRLSDPRSPTVLSFGHFCAGEAPNVIPESATLKGTLRTFDETWRAQAKERITQLITHQTSAWGAKVDISWKPGYPVLINDPHPTAHVETIAKALGFTVQPLPLWLSSEDFAFYAQQVPACFIRLGTAGTEPDSHAPVHTSRFTIDEAALPLGSALLAALALSHLKTTLEGLAPT